MKLIGSSSSPYVRKVRVVMAEKKLDYQLFMEDVWSADTTIMQSNPLGKVPCLVMEGQDTITGSVFDSRVIVEYLDTVSPVSRLIPEPSRQRIAVRRWEALADGVLDAGLLARYESLRPKKEQSAAWSAKQLGKVTRGIDLLAADLGARTWCHAERYSLADIALGCCLGWLAFRHPSIDWRGEHASLARHFERVMSRPAFADTVPADQ